MFLYGMESHDSWHYDRSSWNHYTDVSYSALQRFKIRSGKAFYTEKKRKGDCYNQTGLEEKTVLEGVE